MPTERPRPAPRLAPRAEPRQPARGKNRTGASLEPKPFTPDLFANSTQHSPASLMHSHGLDSLSAAHAAYSARTNAPSQDAKGLKWLIAALVLLAVNAALWVAFTSEKEVLGSNSEARVQADVAADKISFPSAGQLSIKPNINPKSASPAQPAPKPPAPMEAGAACMVWEFSSNADYKRADNRLAEQAWSSYRSELAPEPSSYLVFVGPYKTQAQLDAKLKVLKKLKLEDVSVLPDDSISLGVLSSAEAAKALQNKLGKRGLSDVEVFERSSGKRRNRFRFDALGSAKLADLQTLAQDLGQLRACPP